MNMPTLYLKKLRETERVELGIEGAVEELPVKELRESVVEKLNISNEELCMQMNVSVHISFMRNSCNSNQTLCNRFGVWWACPEARKDSWTL